MRASNQQFRPYFYNGLLVIPEKTVKALIEVGLDWHIGLDATRGIQLDDAASLRAINDAVARLTGQLPSEHPLQSALQDADTVFMLTGRPAEVS